MSTLLRVSLALNLIAGRALAQGGPAGFATDTFESRAEVARWLVAYDRAAWQSSDAVTTLPDSLRAGMGPEWFCYQADGRWHAAFGRYDAAADRYLSAVHMVEGDSGYRRVAEQVDSALGPAFGRALHRARSGLPASLLSRVSFNQFVRRRPDGSVEVWLLPAWQPSGWMLHGVEWQYHFSSDGRTVLDSTQTGRRLDPIRPDSGATIVLDDRTYDSPRVASLFFLLAYGRWFRQVYIEDERFRTGLYSGPGSVAWIHVVRAVAPPDSQ